jgi:O-antigen ligase
VVLLFFRTLLGDVRFERGALFWPIAAFTSFVLIGFGYGLATGGDRNAAVWEARPLFYLPIFYILCVNFFTSRRDYMRLAWQALLAMSIESLLAIQYFSTLDEAVRRRLESLLSHQSAMHMNMVFVFLIASLTIPGIRRGTRWMVVVCAIPITWVYLLSQRRAAIVSLAVAIVLLGVVLWRLNRKALLRAGPIFVVLVAGYVGAFWNNTGIAGFPAQAIKTVIAPGSVPEEDQSSDAYRDIENYDLYFTIRSEPLTGVGFGQRFYRPIPLPDISFFPFYEYIPHNSVLWIWLKMGVGGFFVTMLMFAKSLRLGLRTTLRMRKGNEAVIAFVAFSFLPMYLVFTYVDISWDGRSMMLVAIAMAVAGQFADLPRHAGELPDVGDDGGEVPGVRVDGRPRLDPPPAAVAELVGSRRVVE